MTGYDLKTLRLSHDQPAPLPMRVEVDLTGTGLWVSYSTFDVPPSQTLEHAFPPAFSAYWLRLVALGAATATAQLSLPLSEPSPPPPSAAASPRSLRRPRQTLEQALPPAISADWLRVEALGAAHSHRATVPNR